ncbi:MAG: cobalamin B12-binding domain-containing protein, partial [Tissierellaceae bacterium]
MKKIIAGSMGNCVHVAGIMNYLNLAEKEGFETDFIGIGKTVDQLIEIIREKDPDIVALSYRLTPEPLNNILEELKIKINENNMEDKVFIFGGTEPTAEVAERWGIFQKIFNGSEDIDEVMAYLKGKDYALEESYPREIISRI